MKAPARSLLFALLALGLVVAAFTGLASGKASHKGWPRIDGHLKMHSSDRSGRMRGSGRSDELLGGHGNDVILGRERIRRDLGRLQALLPAQSPSTTC